MCVQDNDKKEKEVFGKSHDERTQENFILGEVKANKDFEQARENGDRNTPPRSTMECVRVWFKDGRGHFKMEVRREDFWF